jgi:hypothetical protein
VNDSRDTTRGREKKQNFDFTKVGGQVACGGALAYLLIKKIVEFDYVDYLYVDCAP